MKKLLIAALLFVATSCFGQAKKIMMSKDDQGYFRLLDQADTSYVFITDATRRAGLGSAYSLKEKLPDGEYEIYVNQNLKAKYAYSNGLRSGDWTNLYDNGQIERLVPYLNGKLHGYRRKYFEDGKLMEQIFYVDDKAEGTSFFNYPSGNAKSKYYHKNGKTYKRETFDEDGKIIIIEEY